jgi:hypothetical protein
MLHHERSNQKELHLNVNGGIGNRFVSLFTAIRLLDQRYFDLLYVYWPVDNACMAYLSDLFYIRSERIIELRKNHEGASFIKASKTQKHVTSNSWLLILDNADQVFLNTTCPIGKPGDEADTKWLLEMPDCLPLYLEIKQEFLLKATLIALPHKIEPTTIGIHCRRSDSGLVEIAALFPQDIAKISAKYKQSVDLYVLEYMRNNGIVDLPKYLASEDKNTKAFMKHHTKNTIMQEIKSEVKMLYDIKSNWQEDQFDKTHYWWMTVRSRDSIYEAFVDWINLSRCGTIYTDYSSTFAASATFYTNVNVVNIGRPML